MNFINMLIIVIFNYYIYYILIVLVSKTHRKNVVTINSKLNKFRTIKIKTIEEQKKFLDLKYPKSQFKWNKQTIFILIIKILTSFVLFFLMLFIFNKLKINIPWWLGILLVIFIPMGFNYILKKFQLQKA
jgi:hypothetical protein